MGTTTLDPNYDLTLIVGPNSHRFHVSRKVLTLACPVWSRMLNGPFLESATSEIPLPEDDEGAFLIILKILHYQFSALPKNMHFEELRALAILVEKYDLFHILQPFWEDWVCPRLQSDLYKKGQEEWLFVAWVFGQKEEFVSLALHLARYMGSNQSLLMEKIVLPPGLLDSLLLQRSKYLETTTSYCTRQLQKALMKGNQLCVKSSTTSKMQSLCASTMLGSLIRKLNWCEMFPIPEVDDIHESPHEIHVRLASIEMESVEGHRDCMNWFWNRMSLHRYLNDADDALLHDHLTSLERHASSLNASLGREPEPKEASVSYP